MANLRRGKVTTPHKPSDSILLTRFTGTPIRIPIERILHWEEWQLSNMMQKGVCIAWDLSTTVVMESFDAIEQEINGKAVQP